MNRCLRCKDKCLKEEGSYLKEKINKTIQKFDEKFNEKFNEEINTNPTSSKLKSKEEKKCVFAGESQYDIKEIKRVHNLIFEGEGLKVCFVDGGLGSGKSYKVDKVLEYRNTSNNKVESLMFESFQTGYNENFIYILFLELVKNEKKKPSFKKHWKVFKNNISISNFILSIPVTLSLLIVFYTVFKVFDFTKQDLISTNVGYLIIIAITVIISLYILPYALTFRKEYTILNRDYYYNLVTKLLPDVLIIDDFERLTENQRRQVYEFINYLRANETDENKVETKLKRILILGDLKAVESAELLFKEGTKERITKEAFVTKYYDQRIVLGNWIDTFTEKYNTDYPQLPLNNAETEHITKFLKYMSPILTRREFVMFMNNVEFNYDSKSFEQELIENLGVTKQFELVDNLKRSSNTQIETGTDMYNDLKLLITWEIPVNRTLYSKGNKIVNNKTLKEMIDQYIRLDIDNLNLLLDSIIENNGNEKKKIEFFKTEKITRRFRKYCKLITKDETLGAKLRGYEFKDSFQDFFEANEISMKSKTRGDTVYKEFLKTWVDKKTYLQILADMYLEDKELLLDPFEIFYGDKSDYSIEFRQNGSLHESGYTLEEFNKEFKENVEQFILFKENIIFCLIELHNKQFNTKEALNAYEIVHTKDLELLLAQINEDTNFGLIFKYQEESYNNTETFEQLVVKIKQIADTKRSNATEALSKYNDEPWFEHVNEFVNDINDVTPEKYYTFVEKHSYMPLNILLEIRNDLVNGKLLVKLIEYEKYDDANLLFDKVEYDKIHDFMLEDEKLSPINNMYSLNGLSDENRCVVLGTLKQQDFSKIKKEYYNDYIELLHNGILLCHDDANYELGQFLLDNILTDIENNNDVDREVFSHALIYIGLCNEVGLRNETIKTTEKLLNFIKRNFEIGEDDGFMQDKIMGVNIEYKNLFDIDITEILKMRD